MAPSGSDDRFDPVMGQMELPLFDAPPPRQPLGPPLSDGGPRQMELPLNLSRQMQLPLFDMPQSIESVPTAPESADFEAISIFDDPDANEVGQYPARLTEVPTSTTNPARPRTVAAGYNHRSQTLTVVFRDGTWWNYYHVSAMIWKNFKNAYSKGWYLYASGLDRWATMGPTNSGFLTDADQTTLTMHARAAQAQSGGLQGGHTAAYMNRLKKQDAAIKKKNILTPARDRISNPYVQRQRTRKRRGA